MMQSRKKFFIIGILLIIIALLANKWLLTALFSADGQLDPRSVVIIWLFEALVLLGGLRANHPKLYQLANQPRYPRLTNAQCLCQIADR